MHIRVHVCKGYVSNDSGSRRGAVCCSVLQRLAMCCRVSQSAMCCSVLQCVAVCRRLVRWLLNFRSRISGVCERICVVLIVQTSRTCEMRKCLSFLTVQTSEVRFFTDQVVVFWCSDPVLKVGSLLKSRWCCVDDVRSTCDMIHHTTRDEVHYTIHVITTTRLANTRHVSSRSIFFEIW